MMMLSVLFYLCNAPVGWHMKNLQHALTFQLLCSIMLLNLMDTLLLKHVFLLQE